MLKNIHTDVQEGSPLKVVVAGHVDDGKSTLIGRLLYETGSLPDGKFEELVALSAKRGMQLEWSFILDAFQAERNQAITMDTTHIRLKTPNGEVVIIDAPGHIEFLKNMVSGAANADAALLLVDATHGMREQTRRHAYLLHLLGIRQVTILINKMDLVDFSQSCFKQISAELNIYLKEIGINPFAIIPISARHGDMLFNRSDALPWYIGPTVLESINHFIHYSGSNTEPLRFPVQDVYKFDIRRIIAGKIESGILRVGENLLFSPSGQTARVQSIETWNAPSQTEAFNGQSIGITFDKQLFVERGEVISHIEQPPMLTMVFRATLFWLGQHFLEEGKTYKMKLSTRECFVTIQTIEHEMNIESLIKSKTQTIAMNGCGEVTLRTRELIPVDEYHLLPRTGRFVLIDGYEIIAGGMISMEGYRDQGNKHIINNLNLTTVPHYVTRENRFQHNCHKGGVLWLTGLSGAGKSTLAMKVEHFLFNKGYQIYTLDGDNIRKGLNKNLGFSPEDRVENIRRIGEVAALFLDAGFICMTAFISPYQIDREKARRMAPQDSFHEIYVKADLEVCENRDPKGLYKKARSGKISQFTGVTAPYEAPLNPELIVDTTILDVEECVNMIIEYVKKNFIITSITQEQN